MPREPLFAGLVVDEYDNAVEVAYVGEEPCYVVDDRGFELFNEAIRLNPHSLAIHQKIWKLLGGANLDQTKVDDYIKLTEEIIFFLDPFVCIECGYKTTEFLWKCPHCHYWDSFSEIRM